MNDSAKRSLFIVGLGNPGEKYRSTRHNIGFLVVDEFASRQNLNPKFDARFNARCCRGELEGVNLHLILPQTFMNLSGSAVKRYLDYFKGNHNQMIVVLDDVAIPFGDLRLRPRGSSGGHNGLKSLESYLNTQEYGRLRVGVDAPKDQDLADYVLQNFNYEERQELPKVIDLAVEILTRLLKDGISEVIQKGHCVQAGSKKIEKKAEQSDLTKPPLEG